ncbi:ABC-type transport auxiliary lipoprotein family protein [Kordiimonas aestuarii]|uniref:ABC-type transport auxiliary lipoprotein family protein n=1 Tax=Kordiimonas aestuarii TaxID=1005925 RepID=UPI0021D0D4F9|nr:ABC-type transport auxiliary lipoprotein family protein [Kordiimonas aestuarii]
MIKLSMLLRRYGGALLLASAAAVSGCGPIISFGGDGPGDTVYSLKYPGGYHTNGDDAPVIYVDEPHMADGLAGQKIAVALAGERRSTLKGARWSAPLSTLVRDYVARALGDKAGAHMIGEGGLDIHAGCRLGTKVWALEFVPGGDVGGDKVEIAIEMSLVRLSDSTLISHPTFTRSMSVQGTDGDVVMTAFNRAMAATADEMGLWLKDQVDACRAPVK